jgi:hypothetical protein
MSLDSIVNVTITSQTQSISEPGFGTPLILGTNKTFTDLARAYSSISGVAEDFTPQQLEYIAAQAVFSQNPTVEQLYIGRRDVPVVTMNVTTPLLNQSYTVAVNGAPATIANSNSLQQKSVVTMSADFVSNNLINVVANGIVLGTITSKIVYSADFGTDNIITTFVNGIELTPVTWTSSQSNTLVLIAATIAGAAGVTSATPGTDSITVVFTSPGANTVNSSIATGTTPPTTVISEGGFTFTSTQAATMALIVTALEGLSTVMSASATGDVLTITSNAMQITTVNSVNVYLGVSQATATIVNDTLAATIAKALVVAINALPAVAVTAAYVTSPDGTFTTTANVLTTAYTIGVSTNIGDPNVCIVEITDAIVNQNYFVTLKGVTLTYTAVLYDTEETIVSQLVNKINSYTPSLNITAVNNSDNTFTLTNNIFTETFSISVSAQVMAIIKGINILPFVAAGDVTTRLNDILNLDIDFYAVACTDRTVGIVQAIANWAQANMKIFGSSSNDPNIIGQAPGDDVTSIAAYFQDNNLTRSFCLYHEDAAEEFPECAWMGNVLPLAPGSETWKFKTLVGVQPSMLTTNQTNNALGKDCNIYTYVGGIGITQNGTMGSGEFIDIIRGIDWLQSIITINVFGLLAKSPKVPYTDAGIAAIESEIKRALQQGIDQNFLSNNPFPVVTVPLAANVSTNDKNNRILKNVTFTATLAGAIHSVTINGTLTV